MKTCCQCQVPFEITDADRVFYDKVSPIFGGVKYAIPEPTLCPDCRQQRRLAFRNERKLYRRKCNHCNKEIISIYRPDTLFPVFCNECWWGDNWNPLDYGQEFYGNKPFFSQFTELFQKIPKMALVVQGDNENAEFTNCASYNKNCYLVFSSNKNEQCSYGKFMNNSIASLDGMNVFSCELCYECIDCEKCYHSLFLQNCKNCSDSYFLQNCISCRHCFGCVNLQNQEYCFYNKKLSHEEYEKRIQELNITSHANIRQEYLRFLAFSQQFPCKYLHGIQSEDSTGDYLFNCKNAHNCFDSQKLWDCSFCQNIDNADNCYDISYYGGTQKNELLYECEGVGHGVLSVLFSKLIWGGSSEVLFSYECTASSFLFACVGLQRKKYCILNKQYTKEEYEALVPKIIDHMRNTGEWGEFFPASISPFGYNETVANEYFPLSRDAALQRLYKWSDYEAPKPEATKVITAEQMKRLPDSINQIPDDVLNWALTCEVSGKLYKIQKAELAFYRKMKLPIPHRHPDQRHADRMALRNPRRLWKRNCAECNTAIETTYSPDRPEKVLCEECYLKAVV